MFLVNQFDRVFEESDPDRIRECLGTGKMREATQEDMDRYHARMEARNRDAGNEDSLKESIYFNTVPASPDGYGMSRDLIKRELLNMGTHLHENYVGQKVGLLYSYPHSVIRMQSDIRLIYTMFESDKIPIDWVDPLNEADEVIVPSRWCQEVFAKFGVKTTVVPLGYNDRVFKYIDRPIPVKESKDFTFLHYNAFTTRKGFWEVLEAFEKEFEHNEPVKLIMKTTSSAPQIPLLPTQYPNIEVITNQVSETDLLAILARSNCMVFPSHGEGFGITPLESMATGIPVIVPNAHGISEYFNPEYMLEAEVEKKIIGETNRFKGQDVGEMVQCSVEDLRKKMRYAYNHQAEMKELGLKASKYVTKWTYRETASKLKVILDKWQAADVPKREDTNYLRLEAF